MREIVAEAGLQPFPDAYVEGFAFDEEGQITYPGMQVAVRARAPCHPRQPTVPGLADAQSLQQNASFIAGCSLCRRGLVVWLK